MSTTPTYEILTYSDTLSDRRDSAEADSPESARFAAETLLRDAIADGCYKPRAAIYRDGTLVRMDITLYDTATVAL